MEINLKEKLRTLRQRKNVTQEALANHLGITPQSVGKWERGEGFPDITLLPKIAFYFDVTVDELLCVDRLKIEENINEYQNQSRIYQQTGENEKLLELWEKAYDEFPNEHWHAVPVPDACPAEVRTGRTGKGRSGYCDWYPPCSFRRCEI